MKSSPGCSQYLNELIYLKDLALEKNYSNIIEILTNWISNIKKKCPEEQELKEVIEKLTR